MIKTQLKELIRSLEQLAPPIYQESYDNAGLIVGNPTSEIEGVMTCLDATEAVLEEAIAKNCNVVVAHHPIVFKGLKSFTGQNYVERVVMKAIKQDIALYAIHTNLDNMFLNGVNTKIAERLQLQDTKMLSPKANIQKLNISVTKENSPKIRNYLYEFGELVALKGQSEDRKEVEKLELTFPIHLQSKVMERIKNKPIVRCEITSVQNYLGNVGSGIIGELAAPMEADAFLAYLKKQMKVNVIRHTTLLHKPIQRVAVCGGAGGFLLPKAIQQQADVFVTADYKYHEFFDADGHLVIADIGHYESEQFTIELLQAHISKKFTTFATFSTTINTNPVFYYT